MIIPRFGFAFSAKYRQVSGIKYQRPTGNICAWIQLTGGGELMSLISPKQTFYFTQKKIVIKERWTGRASNLLILEPFS
jgi:hypothetical protein